MQDAPLQQAPIADSAQVDVSIDDSTFSPYLPVAQIPKLPTGVALSFFFSVSLSWHDVVCRWPAILAISEPAILFVSSLDTE